MHAALAVSKPNHNEPNVHRQAGKYLGKVPAGGAAKADAVAGFIRDFHPQDALAYRPLP